MSESDTSERFETLENRIKELSAQNQTILLLLGQLAGTTSEPSIKASPSLVYPPLPPSVPPTPTRPPRSLPPIPPPRFPSPQAKDLGAGFHLSGASTESHHTPKLKPASPNDFDGDRTKGRAFLSSCELYFQLAPHLFPDPNTAVHWVMSYMKAGRASLFKERVLREEFRTQMPKFPTWTEFREAFVSEFCPKNETQLAVAKLETNGYYQGRKTVQEYLDEFRDLIDLSGYKDGLPITVKFRRGLNREIQDQIAQLAIGRPRDDQPEEWYQAAVTADENRTTNLLFHGGSRMPTPRTSGGFIPTQRLVSPIQGPRLPTSTPPRLGGNYQARNERTKEEQPDSCRRCGKTGHWAKDCEKRFDIRLMTMDEKEEWLQELALQADTVELEGRLAESETGPESEVGPTPKDFPEGSG
jgi:Retrotransposon gag protein/Zinc knuckle